MPVIEINGSTEMDNKINKNNRDELANSEEDTVMFPRLGNISYDEFFHDYMLANVPCVLDLKHTSSWPSRQDWVKKENGELVPDLTRNKNDADHFKPKMSVRAEKSSVFIKDFTTTELLFDWYLTWSLIILLIESRGF